MSHPNRSMYRPGSVTRPACAHVILLTANHFPFAFSPDSSARFAPSKDQFLSARKKWQVAGFLIGRKARIRFGNFVYPTLQARPSHRLAIVTAAENHFLAANDNYDIANRRIRITPDRNFRRSVIGRHRNNFLCPKAFRQKLALNR